MAKEAVRPAIGAETKGPYSPAVVIDNLVFVSGQGPIDPKTGAFVRGDVAEETRIAIQNLKLILEAAGSNLGNVLKVTLYLSDMDDFHAANEAYKEWFGPVFPARTTIEAARLPFDIKVEIDAIAFKQR